MAVIGISRSETFEYVLDSDPCKKRVELEVPRIEDGQKITHDEVIEEGATIFTLGVLDVFLMGLIYDQSTLVTRNDEDHQIGVTTRLNQTNIEAVRFGLKGWRNFPDAEGNDIPFETVHKVVNGRKYQVVSDDCLARLGIRDIQELGQQIKEKSEVSKREAKNSAMA